MMAPVIFMGDLNAVPTAPELAPLYTALVDTAAGFDEAELMSIDSKNPRKRIDYIFTNNMLKTVSVEVPKVLYSDHCPYIALLEKAQ